MDNVTDAVWAAIFIMLGTGLLMGREATDGAWPVVIGALSYACAVFFLFRLVLWSDR